VQRWRRSELAPRVCRDANDRTGKHVVKKLSPAAIEVNVCMISHGAMTSSTVIGSRVCIIDQVDSYCRSLSLSVFRHGTSCHIHSPQPSWQPAGVAGLAVGSFGLRRRDILVT